MQATLENLFETEFDLNISEMEELKVYNVEEANIGIKAYDELKSQIVYAKILACIKKPATKAISIKLQGRDEFEEPVSDKHLYAVYIEDTGLVNYSYAKDLKKGIKIFTEDGFVEIEKVKEAEKDFWLDVQTETGNYFTNGILSHNSPMSHLNSLTGGFAVNYYASTRFRVSAKEPILRNGEIVGLKMKIKNYKNKTGVPNRECFLDVYFKDGDGFKAGIDGEGQYLDMLLDLEIIKQRGAWYYYREDDPDETKRQKFQGWANVQQWFKDNPNEFESVKKLVDAKMSSFNEMLDKNTVVGNELEDIKEDQKALLASELNQEIKSET